MQHYLNVSAANIHSGMQHSLHPIQRSLMHKAQFTLMPELAMRPCPPRTFCSVPCSLITKDFRDGSGPTPVDGQEVVFQYTGYNESASVIDTSFRQVGFSRRAHDKTHFIATGWCCMQAGRMRTRCKEQPSGGCASRKCIRCACTLQP